MVNIDDKCQMITAPTTAYYLEMEPFNSPPKEDGVSWVPRYYMDEKLDRNMLDRYLKHDLLFCEQNGVNLVSWGGENIMNRVAKWTWNGTCRGNFMAIRKIHDWNMPIKYDDEHWMMYDLIWRDGRVLRNNWMRSSPANNFYPQGGWGTDVFRSRTCAKEQLQMLAVYRFTKASVNVHIPNALELSVDNKMISIARQRMGPWQPLPTEFEIEYWRESTPEDEMQWRKVPPTLASYNGVDADALNINMNKKDYVFSRARQQPAPRKFSCTEPKPRTNKFLTRRGPDKKKTAMIASSAMIARGYRVRMGDSETRLINDVAYDLDWKFLGKKAGYFRAPTDMLVENNNGLLFVPEHTRGRVAGIVLVSRSNRETREEYDTRHEVHDVHQTDV